ncbi:MAG: 2-isopropylmalate synthase [Betaproteobacteria bacterium]|nr:2-isopropylmalate synthase [Betaproteobacteria bacterium]
MLQHPETKYRPFSHSPHIALRGRRWPDRRIERAPVWMSSDLRDGNQALFEPMNAEAKLRFFKRLVAMGFKEIEIAFPSASQTEFDFTRLLIEGGHIPEDVTIEILSPARAPLIERSFEALDGARRAIVHLYNAIAPAFREIVFGTDRAGIKALAVEATRVIRREAEKRPQTEWVFQYSPETFSAAETDFAREICDAVFDVWQPTPERKAIVNLPATVEVASPNVYADQIEWMHRNLKHRDALILSVHPHNDRGCAVAAAELALMAGAERVEGCLFGNGERTGNADLVTLALNLYAQGIDPGLDFSRIDEIARCAEECTRIPVHPRHPYAGDLVFTAFSGSHQDAIKKGMAARKAGKEAHWEVPYLPVDPADLGRTYDSIIRINSQSGKGGVAWLLEAAYGFVIPRRLQVEFGSAVQRHADESGREISAEEIREFFEREYLFPVDSFRLLGHRLHETEAGRQHIEIFLEREGKNFSCSGFGKDFIDAAWQALNASAAGLKLLSHEERPAASKSGTRTAAFVEIAADGIPGALFGVGIDADKAAASLQALINAIARAAVDGAIAIVPCKLGEAKCA